MPGQGERPLPPGFVVLIVQDAKTGVVVQPGALLVRPALEVGMSHWILLRPGIKQGIAEGSGPLPGEAEVHMHRSLERCISSGSSPEGVTADESLIGQVLAVQEPGVQRIAGGRAVGRAGGIRRSQRQHLPDADVMVGQQLEPTATRLSKAAADGTARQGGGMQQHPSAAPRFSLGQVNSGLIHGGLFVSQGWLLQKSAASPRSCPAMPSRATRSKNCSSVSVP